MTKLKHYLKEFQEDLDDSKTRVKSISKKEALNLLKTKASDAYDNYLKHNGQVIRRRTETARQITAGFLDASKLPERMSRNTKNYYTHIMNHDPSWSKYPKRQIIASLDKNGSASTSPNVFYIFPYNNTKIGVAPADDLWDSFSNLSKLNTTAYASGFNEYIEILLRAARVSPENADKSLSSFKAAAAKFDKWFKKVKAEEGPMFDMEEFVELIDGGSRAFRKYRKFMPEFYKGNLYEAVKEIFSSKGFKTMTPKEYGKAKHWNEVWLDGPAVYINSEAIDRVIPRDDDLDALLKGDD